jgi:hypothetical protein
MEKKSVKDGRWKIEDGRKRKIETKCSKDNEERKCMKWEIERHERESETKKLTEMVMDDRCSVQYSTALGYE